MLIAIDQIRIIDRRRRDLGDIQELANSIAAVGLLHPPVVTPDYRLVAGERRLAACRLLGWTMVPVTVVDEVDDVYAALCAERDENTCRKDFTPLEALAVAAAIEPFERRAAEERQRAGVRPPENFAEGGGAIDRTAAAVGMSRPTLTKARAVVQAAEEHPELLGDLPDTMDRTGKVDGVFKEMQRRIRRAEHEAQAQAAPDRPVIDADDCAAWIGRQPMCDLLLTDPPYATDVDDIAAFAAAWLPQALARVKATGRAYVCIGAYPEELAAYLTANHAGMVLEQVLVWTYRNTIGPSPRHIYKQNWHAILYFCGPEAPPLDCPDLTEQFSVLDINAPDGRLGDRYHTWQKPDGLAERLIRHSTRPGDLVLDPFAGTGTFVLAAARLGRQSRGCDSDPAMRALARQRGCDAA